MTEITVRGQNRAETLRRSAQAVTVIETTEAKREASDLGQVLSRSVGVSVRRTGGLGSTSRIALYGLTDDQIRYYLDEVPLDFMGFGQGVANMPVNLIDRVEIYRGVVPVRFGADALGGVVHVVTDDDRRPRAAEASYQVGSFGTYRASLAAKQSFGGSFRAAATASWDQAQNNYPVEVLATDPLGQLYAARVRRFHDAYSALGGSVDLGVVRQPWATKLSLKLFSNGYEKDLQHNVNMTVPYGEVSYGERTTGASLRYGKTNILVRNLNLSSLLGYSFRSVTFEDVSPYVYDWFGHPIYERTGGTRPPGELTGKGIDSLLWEHRGVLRVALDHRPHPDHRLTLASTGNLSTRTGKDELWSSDRLDPLSGRSTLFSLVTGLEHEAQFLDERIENVFFVKDYALVASADQVIEETNTIRSVERGMTHTFGIGDMFRYRFTEWLWAKASFEEATRLPRPDELFGNGSTLLANLELEPERSSNGNLGIILDVKETRAGNYLLELHGGVRAVRDLILLVPAFDPTYAQYINVASARSLGFDAKAGWTSPGEYLTLGGNVTWVDLRNTSESGPYVAFQGERIPNRPWLMANGSARLRLADLASGGDEAWLAYNAQYVGSFYTGWESAGREDSKKSLPPQLTHSIAVGYLFRSVPNVSASLEVQNLTDAAVYDVFGVQRMGRAVFFKGTVGF